MMLYEERTGLLRAGLFEVQNEVGIGAREEAYHRAFAMWLDGEGVPYHSRAPHHVDLHGATAHTLFPDFVAWDAISIELKAVPRRLRDEDRVQIFNYLKCRGDRLGLLVNLGLDRVHVERYMFDPPPQDVVEDWKCWSDQVQSVDRRVGAQVRESLLAIFREHATGYGTEVTGKLIQCSLKHRRLSFRERPTAPAIFRGRQVDEAPLDGLIVADRILLVFTALFDDNEFNVSRGLSHLRALGLEWGIAANFGKKQLQVTGLRRKK